MVGSGGDHGGDLVLGETVLAGETGAAVALHEAGGGVAVAVVGGVDTDVAGGFLHDDAEDDTGLELAECRAFGVGWNLPLLNTDLGTLVDGVPDTANVLTSVAGSGHGRLVGVEDILERLPLVPGRERRGGAGVADETHFD